MSNQTQDSVVDELARVIGSGLDGWDNFDAGSEDWKSEMRDAAVKVLAAGYRPPARTVATVEELTELPVGAVLRDTYGNVYEQPHTHEVGLMVTGHCGRVRYENALEFSPLTVLYEPSAEATS